MKNNNKPAYVQPVLKVKPSPESVCVILSAILNEREMTIEEAISKARAIAEKVFN